MGDISVDTRVFHFPDGWRVMKYDDIPYYQNHLKNKKGWKRGMKAVDLVAYNPGDKMLYLIESKDYREHQREKRTPPAKEFFDKVMDTLTGLIPPALCSATNTAGESDLQAGIKGAQKLRLIYQFEQPTKHSKLHPRVFDPADIQLKLRSELRCFDPHTLVIEAATQSKVAWTVS